MLLAFSNVSCDSINAGAGIPVPFTSGAGGVPIKVALDVRADVLPPKFCIGLDVKE
tara:strand:- start:1145 stop:1312 length:168 start_codon:yes stop_codon:yes gene_type:complete